MHSLTEDFDLDVTVFCFAANYFDRYMYSKYIKQSPPDRNSLTTMQVIASTCVLIAAKFSSKRLPPISELQSVHNHNVPTSAFVQTEYDILQTLKWKLNTILPYTYLHIICTVSNVPKNTAEDLAHFLKLGTYDYEMLQYSSSHIAASVILAAFRAKDTMQILTIINPLARLCNLSPIQLTQCMDDLIIL